MKPIGTNLVVATHNAGKLREIRDLLAPFAIECVGAAELDLPEPEETGTTFVANAELKALAAAERTGLPALSDDSGLSVDALGGKPGIHSARWAEDASGKRDFGFAMEQVERAIEAAGPDAGRAAHFTCVLSLAWPDGSVESFEGEVHGTLVWPPRGDKGFGYDPMFVANGMTETFAEIEPAAKHAMSHRAKAFEKLVAALQP